MTVQATAGANGANGAPPGTGNQSLWKYFQHAVGTGLRPKKIHEGLFDFKVDQHSIISTGGEPKLDAVIRRILGLFLKFDKTTMLMPFNEATHAYQPLQKTSNVPSGTILLNYYNGKYEVIEMGRNRQGIRFRMRLKLNFSLNHFKFRCPGFMTAISDKDKQIWISPITCKATNAIRVGYFKNWNPYYTNRSLFMTELGKRGLGFDDPSEAHGFVIPNTVGMRTDGLRGPALILMVDKDKAPEWQEKLMDMTLDEDIIPDSYYTKKMDFVPFNTGGVFTRTMASKLMLEHGSLIKWISARRVFG